MLLRLKAGMTTRKEEEEIRVFENSEFSLRLKKVPESIEQAFLRILIDFFDETTLVNEIQQEDRTKVASFYYYLNWFDRRGLIVYKTRLFELSYSGIAPNESIVELGKSIQLSRFALCRLDHNEMVIETPLAPSRITVKDNLGLQLYYVLHQSSSLEDLSKQLPQIPLKDLEESLNLLCRAQIMTCHQEQAVLAQWEFHDLLFHSRSRLGRHDFPFGGTYPFKETSILPLASAKECSKERQLITLNKPESILTPPYFSILKERRSLREQGEVPIHLSQVSAFLYHSVYGKKLNRRPEHEVSSRLYPSPGACYPLEVYLVIHSCEGIERGVYHYHPFEHVLCKVSAMTVESEDLLKDTLCSTGESEYPQILIVISARFQRVSWKYQSIAYALILKEVGALIQTMYLTATALGLAPCAIGGGDADLFSKIIGTDYLEETSVGEFLLNSIGSVASSRVRP